MSLNSSSHYVELDAYSDAISKLKKAESRTKLSHYTSIDNAEKILITKQLKCMCITSYSKKNESHEKYGMNSNFREECFIFSFSHNKDVYNKSLWEDFGDNEKGVKIIFKNKVGSLHKKMIDTSRYCQCYSKSDELKIEIGTNVSSVNFSGLCMNIEPATDCGFDVKLTDTIYKSVKNINYNIQIKNGNSLESGLNVTTACNCVDYIYIEEDETRLTGILEGVSSGTKIEFEYIMLPISFDNIDISVDFGKKTSEDDRQRILKIVKEINNSKK